MSALARIAHDPKATLRRAGIATGLAVIVVALSTAAVITADGPVWIVYATALVLAALATMQILIPGAGVRLARPSTDLLGLRLRIHALTAAMATEERRVVEETLRQDERLFEPEETAARFSSSSLAAWAETFGQRSEYVPPKTLDVVRALADLDDATRIEVFAEAAKLRAALRGGSAESAASE